jgi:shikimate 5-dehydrogenase
VLGAGGAAAAAAAALVAEGARPTIHARNLPAATELARRTGAATGAWPPARGSWDLLVNATPLGTIPLSEESPMAGSALDGRLVYDLVYNPRKTRLLADAESAGCHTLNGLPMLVEQALLQFEWWTGRRPARHLFEAAACRRLDEGDAAGAREAIP